MYDIIIGRSQSDLEKYGPKGTILLGKHYVKMGQITSLSNSILLDVTRSHVVFVCGKRGCLTEDTSIFTDKGYKKIKDFDEKKDEILTFNQKSTKLEWEKNAKLVKYDLAEKEELIKIEFLDGQRLILTQEHPLFVFDKKKKAGNWKNASEILINDSVLTNYSLPRVGKGKDNKNSLRVARLLGFLLADGTMQIRKGEFIDGRGYKYYGKKARLRIINNSPEVLAQAKEDLEKEFKIGAALYKKGKENCYIVESKQQKVLSFFNRLGVPLGKKDKIIRILPVIWSSSNKFKKEFIKALFSCDGFVDKNGSRIVYYSNSKLIISELNLLLAHFTIQSRLREKRTRLNGKRFLSYQLDIMDYNSIQNFKKIGFFQKEKNERLLKRKFHRMKQRKSTIYLNNYFFYQKIKSISKIKKISKVYDLCVEKNSSFIANGVISHNSGKSFTMGVIAEGVSDLPEEIRENISVVILDTMGIYWTMKYPNQKERDLLEKWNIKPKGLDVKIFTPSGHFKEFKEKGIPADFPFSIRPDELDIEDWILTLGIERHSEEGVIIEKAITELKESKAAFSLKEIASKINLDQKASQKARDAATNMINNAETWGLFNKEGTPLNDLVKGGQVTILDVSIYATMPGGWDIKSLVIGLVSKKLFTQRMISRRDEEFSSVHETVHYFADEEKKKMEYPMVWLIIDEAHEFLPVQGTTPASAPLITILREGRQPGISLVLATQQPGKIHTDVMTQSDVIISHRITAKLDTDALGMLMQSYMRKGLDQYLDDLPRENGAAVILDDNNERMYPFRVRPRFTWHGGEAPVAIPAEKKVFSF